MAILFGKVTIFDQNTQFSSTVYVIGTRERKILIQGKLK